MNISEFAKLKPGDEIVNAFPNWSEGVITEATSSGVSVRWEENTPPVHYSVNSRAWTHWSHRAEWDR